MFSARNRAFIDVIIASAIWGIAVVVVKIGVTDMPPLLLLTYRYFISSIVALISLRNIPNLDKLFTSKYSPLFIFTALLNIPVTLALYFYGVSLTTSFMASLISSLGPVIALFLGTLFFREKSTSQEKTGLGIAFTATVGASLSPANILRSGIAAFGVGNASGNILMVIGTFIETLASLLIRKLESAKIDPLVFTHVSFVIALVVTLPFSLLITSPVTSVQILMSLPLRTHLAVLYLALISGSLAYYLWHRALKVISVSEASMFTYTRPLWTLPFSILLLGESINLWILVCGVGILCGVVYAEHHRRKSHSVDRQVLKASRKKR